ncbi:hypothetical protein [Providencia vermicola]|uniref:hypothetical protein n=1 Tax=Providencia vermicola TaxID=333965 RepID=UPI0032DB4255
MKKALTAGVILVGVVAGVSVNFVSEKKANEFYLVSHCSNMTKSIMKSPSSYKMLSYKTFSYPTPDEFISERDRSFENEIKKDNPSESVIFDTQSVTIGYEANNASGINFTGESSCSFTRAHNDNIVFGVYPRLFIVDNKPPINSDEISAKLLAENSIGPYQRKLNYLINQILN